MLLPNLFFPTCRRSFWILMCCLLITHEFHVHATSEILTRFKPRKGNFVPVAVEKLDDFCAEWQVHDGEKCTCPKPAEEACKSTTGGMVCDQFGNNYPSLCSLAVQVCRGEISTNHDISSCGQCPKLRLMNSKILHLSSVYGLKTFSLKKGTAGQNAIYTSDDNNNLNIYFEKTLKKWIIGEKRGDKDMLLAQFMDPTPYVQDSQKGAYVVKQNLSNAQQMDVDNGRMTKFEDLFQFDPHLHLECTDEKEKPVDPNKPVAQAFGFLVALVVVSVVAAATTTTLAVVQKEKGCLYYPSVCTMRDEIKDTLKPKLQKLTHDFNIKFGTGDSFKKTLTEVKFAVKETQSNIVLINKLLKDINSNWQESMAKSQEITTLVNTETSDSMADIAQFDEMAKQSVIIESISLGLTIVDAGMTTAALVAGTMSTAAAAFSAALSVVGIAMSAVAIAISVNEEKKLRDKLRTSKSELETSIANVEKANKNMITVQNNLNSKLVIPLKNFAKNVYDTTKEALFNDLYRHLKLEFTIKIPFFKKKLTFSGSNKIDLNWLTKLLEIMEKVVKYTQEKINSLRDLFAQQEEMMQYLDTIKNQVEQFKSPLQIYTGLQVAKVPKLLQGKLSSVASLMHHISKDVLSSSSCFMGFDLISARSCKTCFNQDKICDVPQLKNDKNTIQSYVSQKKPVCLIKSALTSDAFSSNYKVVKYMASYVLPSSSCYWGYNLAEVRADRIPIAKVNKPVIDRSFVLNIKIFESQYDPLSNTKNSLCSEVGICNDAWLNMVLCIINKTYATAVGISCSNAYNNCEAEVAQRFKCPRA